VYERVITTQRMRPRSGMPMTYARVSHPQWRRKKLGRGAGVAASGAVMGGVSVRERSRRRESQPAL
jgi:hypothetical protein